MGFTPLVYGNRKGYMNLNPTPESMNYWGKKLGFSLNSVTNFTDGTKLQIEQVLVANGLDAEIGQRDLYGVEAHSIEESGQLLGKIASEQGVVLSAYALVAKAPASVFIVGTHDDFHQSYLRTYYLGDGPYFVIERPFHLCHIEIVKTIRRAIQQGSILLDNSTMPRASAAAIVKRPLPGGAIIEKGIGSFEVRGTAVTIIDQPDHVPIGLLENAILRHSVEPGQTLTFADVELPDSLALCAWLETRQKVLATAKLHSQAIEDVVETGHSISLVKIDLLQITAPLLENGRFTELFNMLFLLHNEPPAQIIVRN